MKVDGPDLILSPKVATAIALTLHELGTNSVEYGALSAASGNIAINWRESVLEDQPAITLVWPERGGPTVQPSIRKGFGSTMIEKLLTAETGGRATLEFAPEGLMCTVTAPLEPKRV